MLDSYEMMLKYWQTNVLTYLDFLMTMCALCVLCDHPPLLSVSVMEIFIAGPSAGG